LKIAAITLGLDIPSARFRVRQFIQGLKECNIVVTEYFQKQFQVQLPKSFTEIRQRYLAPYYITKLMYEVITRIPDIRKANTHDLVWLQREITPGYYFLEKLLKKPIIFDMDDAIWLNKPYGCSSIKKIIEKSEKVIVGNDFLADYATKYNKNVVVIPTAIDTERFMRTDNQVLQKDEVTIGWTGTSVNFPYLYLIEKSLKKILNKFQHVKFVVMADKPPKFTKIFNYNYEFIYWNIENEIGVLQGWDIGIMPLSDDEHTRGKCSFKMLQYMAMGIPVVVSPVGMNNEVLSKGDVGIAASDYQWEEALEILIQDHVIRNKMGQNGKAVIDLYYSKKVVLHKLEEVFKSCQ
jgi:glycosyltransferase involved in cell wall biosynthesis